jgi:hypothetical protein
MHGYCSISKGAKFSLMDNNLHEVYGDVEKAIDYAFKGQFVLKFYDYLKVRGTKKVEVEEFIQSATANEISNLVMDLEEYLEGGSDEIHKQLREGYGHIPKPQARKIRNYLYGILEDAWRYSHDKRPGRRKKKTK